MPIITVVIGASLPAGLVLYWLVMTLLTVLQQQLMFKKNKTEGEVITNPNENSQQRLN